MEFVKKIISAVVVAGLTISVGGLVGCGGSTTTPSTTVGNSAKPGTTAPAKEEKPAEGTFVSYDKEKKSILVKVGDAEKTYDVAGIKDIKFEEWKKDDKVTVTADKDGKVSKIEKK
jgi:hypothetical protein